MHYRPADGSDALLVLGMVLHATNWHPSRAPLSEQQVMREPKLAHYAAGWPQPGDLGVVVEDGGGNGHGAAWLRYFTDDDPSFGFLDAETPELSIGVSPESRGRGLGTQLCTRLFDAAEARGIRRISLSVEKANPALGLYRRLGFEVVRDDGDAVTMLRQSPAGPTATA
jgi:ribosomal protein S18 acetylase RimI-like enzyme